MNMAFDGEIIYWRGPSPFFFVAIPPEESADLKEISNRVTYGWGVIPVEVRGVQRIFGISRHSVTHWIKHHDSRKNSGIRRKYQDMPIILDIFLMLTPSFFIPS